MTIEAIYNRMTGSFISNPVVVAKYGLTEGKTFNEQFSAVSLERIFFHDVAAAMFYNQQSFNQLKIDIDALLKEKKAHTPSWYATMAKQFQYGCNLNEDTDYYNNTGLTEEQIERTKIVKFAAALSKSNKSILYIKVATANNGTKQPLSATQLSSFQFYISQIQDAGVHIQIINAPADDIAIEMDVYYNPLILDKNGKRLDGSNDESVQDAIKYYVHNLKFNGLYTNAQLVDAVQEVEGVEFPELKVAKSRYGMYKEFSKIDAKEIAYAGYYTIKDENLRLNFLPYDE